MPDAVIVAATRTPIGRAAKGSLVEARPDDMSAFIIDAVLNKVPELPREEIEDYNAGTTYTEGGIDFQFGPGSYDTATYGGPLFEDLGNGDVVVTDVSDDGAGVSHRGDGLAQDKVGRPGHRARHLGVEWNGLFMRRVDVRTV